MSDPNPVPAQVTDAGLPAADDTAPQDPALTGTPTEAPAALPDQSTEMTAGPTTQSSSEQPSTPEEAPQEPVDFVDPSLGYQPPQTSGTEEDLLTGPPGQGESGMPFGMGTDVPEGAQHWLPALQTAATAPGAPPEYQNLLKLVIANIQSLSQE